MSQAVNSTIDERIVEMKFDNKQFESGVKQTMSTLDRLKAALHFDTDTKGIEKIQNTFNNFNLQAPMAAVDAFSQKLSAMQIFGKRIVENLADDFYGAVMKVKSGITAVFNQISTGGANRALNIEQAKFQLEGLHIAWEDIKGDIDYAVSGTAYGLDAAAKVAAQLSASQIQVGDDMKNALRGISGVAAMTNSSYEDIGRVFTQVAGAGRLYTQDMLQLSSRGLNVAAALATQLGKTEGEIREMVTKGQIDFKTFSTAMNEAFGEQATKANNTYTGSLSNVKAALSRIGADIKAGHFETLRQVFVDLIPKINEFKKAFKPVENVIIEVEAAVGRLLQKIISMVDVKKIVEKIAKPVEKFGKKILEIVDVITEALGKVDTITTNSPFATLVSNIKAGYTTFEEYSRKYKYVSREMAMRMGGFGDAVKATGKEIQKTNEETVKMSEDMEKALQAAKDIWNKGTYGNGQQRVDALTAAGIDPKKTQAIIEEFIKNGYNWDEAVKKVSEDTGEGVDENSEKAEKLKKRVQTLATIFSNIKRTFVAVATSVSNVLKALFKSVTGSMEELGVGDILIKVTGFIADMAEKFMITEETASKLTKPVQLLLNIFKKIIRIGGGIVKFIGKVIFGVGKLIYNLGVMIAESETFQSFTKGIKSAFKKVGEGFKYLKTNVKQSEGLTKFLDLLKNIAGFIFGTFLEAVLTVSDVIGEIVPKIGSFLGGIADFFKGVFSGAKTVGGVILGFFQSIVDSIKAGTFIEDVKAAFGFVDDPTAEQEVGESIFAKIANFISSAFGIAASMFEGWSVKEITLVLKSIMSTVVMFETLRVIQRINNIAKQVPSFMKSITNMLNSTAKVNKSVANLNNARAFAQIAKVFLAFAASVGIVMFTITSTAKYLAQGEKETQAFMTALDAVKKVMSQVARHILEIIAVIEFINLGLTLFTSKTKLHVPVLIQFAAFFFAVGYAIKQVLDAIVKLADLDVEVLKEGGKRLAIIGAAIGGFFVILSALLAVINKFLGSSDVATKGLYAMSVVLIAIAASIDILMVAVGWLCIMLEGFGYERVKQATGVVKGLVITIMGMLSVLLAAAALFAGMGGKQDLAKMFATMALLFISIAFNINLLLIALNDLTLSFSLVPTATRNAVITVCLMIAEMFAGIITMMSMINKSGLNSEEKLKAYSKVLSSISKIIFMMMLVVIAAGVISQMVNNETELFTIVGIFSGLTLVLVALSKVLEVIGDKKPKVKAIKSLALVFASLATLLVPLIFFKDMQGWDVAAIAASLAGVALIAMLISKTMEAIGDKKPDPKAIAALALTFSSLALILVPIMAFSSNDGWDPLTALAAMAPLVAIVGIMAKVMEAIGDKKPDYKAVAALGLAFAALGAILVPLIWIKGEDWPAVLAAVGGLALVVGAMSAVMSALSTTTNAGQIVAIGGSFLLMAAGIALIGGVLAHFSSQVDVEGIIGITVAIIALTAALTGLAVIAGKVPGVAKGFLIIGGALLGLSALVLGFTWALNALMERFPDFIQNLRQFAYTIGEIPRLIIEGWKGKDGFDINSPSKVFMEIGDYCIQGFFVGIKDGLVAGVKALAGWLDEYIIQPICKFFKINSPSIKMAEIGDYLAKGLNGGFLSGLEDTIAHSKILNYIVDKQDGKDVTLLGALFGEDLGNGIMTGLSDSLNLEGITENLDLSSLTGLTDSLNIDDMFDKSAFDNFKMDGFGEAIRDSAAESIRGTDFSKIFTLDDLLADPTKYDLLKKAGETQLTAAYERLKEHEDFLAKYPTFESWFNDKSNLGDDWWDIYESATDEQREAMKDSTRQNYLDLSRLNNEVIQYTDSWRDYQDRVLLPADTAVEFTENALKVVNNRKPIEQTVKFNTVDSEGNQIGLGAISAIFAGGKTAGLELNDESLKTNIESVSINFSNAIGDMSKELSQKLTDVSNKLTTLDTNQTGRNNSLMGKLGEVGNSMNNLDVILDSGALVGQLIGPMDSALGELARRKARG